MNVNFPDKVWARLATIADKREMSVSDLLVEAAGDLLGAPRRERKHMKAIDITKLVTLHARGMTDSQIARALDASEGGVRYRRVQLGLPNVKRRTARERNTNPKEGN